jgi:hypothetical protein
MKNSLGYKVLLVFVICVYQFQAIHAQERMPRAVGAFHTVVATSGIDLYLKQSDLNALEVEGVRPSVFQIRTEVTDSILTISALKPTFWPAKYPPKVYIQYISLREIAASGGSDVYAMNVGIFNKIKIQSHSGSDVYFSVECDQLHLTATNGAGIKVSGKAASLVVNASDGSDVHATGLIAQSGLVDASGGSEVVVNVVISLTAQASGKSHIGYVGTPTEQFFNTLGGSAIYPK